MQTDSIETFLDLWETRNFRRTAERLGVAQSTVSGRLRVLEGMLGQPLFLRSRSGVEPTTAAMQFEPHARSLRRGWTEALHAVRQSGAAALTLRIGIQHDLAADYIGDWLTLFRGALPGTGFYFEADYSAQMCTDIIAGNLDLALMYSPRAHPDLHAEPLGDVTYRMVSTETGRLAQVGAETYLLPNYAPAFAETHAALHPGLGAAPVSSGLNAAIAGLIARTGGTSYVLAETAAAMTRAGSCRYVADAPPIGQAVFAAVHVRDRHRPMHLRLLRLLRERFGPPPPRRAGR
ncbi:MAG: LysR family transcriptional regulator [Pseudomonadota bacterium]